MLLRELEQVEQLSVFLYVGYVPVSVLPAPVYLVEGLLVHQSCIAVSLEGLANDLCGQNVLVHSDTCLSEHAGNLELIQGNFIVSGFEGNANFQEFSLDLLKDLFDAVGHFSVVVLGELLVAGRDFSDQASS